MIEQAIVFIDNISLKRSITGKILDILLRTGLDLIGIKMVAPDKTFINDYCRISKSKFSKDYVYHSYLHKRILVLVLQGENAIEKVKYIVGRERKSMKKEYWHGTTIRGMYFGGSRRINFIFKVYENVVQIASERQESSDLIKLVWGKHKENGNSIRHLRGHEMKRDEERTFIMLKPYAIEQRLAGKIIDDLSRSGLYIVGAKIVKPKIEQLKDHYGHLKGKSMNIFRDVVNYMAGIERGKPKKDAKVIHLVYRGPKGEVTRVIRDIIGSTDPQKADIGTIRRSYGKSVRTNVIHASAISEDTERELAIWDTSNELLAPIVDYKPKIFTNF